MNLTSILELLEEEYQISIDETNDYLSTYEQVLELENLNSVSTIDNNIPSRFKGSRNSDFIVGDATNSIIRARKGEDLVLGMGGNDRLHGGKGSDHLVGDFIPSREDYDEQGELIQSRSQTNNDILIGGDDDDILVDQYGSDRLRGGKGDDILISISDSGTPQENARIPAQTEDGDDLDKLKFNGKFFNPENYESNDRLTGGEGSDIFQWNLLINASKSIVDENTEDGIINWGMDGVAGENDNYHDHWVDGIGRDVITDFSGKGGENDQIIINGHTVQATLLSDTGTKAVIGVYSDQGADGQRGGGAHDFDVLGKIIVHHDGNFNFANDVEVEGVDYGAYGPGSEIFDVFQFA